MIVSRIYAASNKEHKGPTQQTQFISNHLYCTAIWLLDVAAKLSCQLKALCTGA